MPEEQKWLAGELGGETPQSQRAERFFPTGGLILRVVSRDLPREAKSADWRSQAWNQDFAWFRAEEARSMLPEKIAVGESRDVPGTLAVRLARASFVDNVRGQTTPYRAESVREAWLIAKVTDVKGNIAAVKLAGKTVTEEKGKWAVAGFRDMNAPTEQTRGCELKLLGNATYDTAKGRFTSFEMVAIGERWGATQYNGRQDDFERAGIGFLLTLVEDKPENRIAPAHFWSYGWR